MLVLDGATDNVGAVFAPGHSQNAVSREDIGYTESDGCGGNVVSLVVLADAVTHFIAEKHESCVARSRGAGFVESDRAVGSYFAERNVDTALACDFFFISLAGFVHCFFCHGRVDSVYVFRLYVDVTEEYFVEASESRRTTGLEREEFRDVEHNHI